MSENFTMSYKDLISQKSAIEIEFNKIKQEIETVNQRLQVLTQAAFRAQGAMQQLEILLGREDKASEKNEDASKEQLPEPKRGRKPRDKK